MTGTALIEARTASIQIPFSILFSGSSLYFLSNIVRDPNSHFNIVSFFASLATGTYSSIRGFQHAQNANHYRSEAAALTTAVAAHLIAEGIQAPSENTAN